MKRSPRFCHGRRASRPGTGPSVLIRLGNSQESYNPIAPVQDQDQRHGARWFHPQQVFLRQKVFQRLDGDVSTPGR